MGVAEDLIRSQLIAEKAFFKYDYGNDALDPYLTNELVRLLVSAGVQDIRHIALWKGIVPIAGQEAVEYMQTSFFYNAKTGLPIEGINGTVDIVQDGQIFAATQNESYSFTYYCRFTGSGVPYFVVGMRSKAGQPGSYWKAFASAIAPVLPVLMIAAAIFLPGIGLAIGQAIMGATAAAAFPAVATVIGNAVVATALNGGDVEAGLKGAVIGSFASGIGGGLGEYLESPAAGAAASAAVSAAVNGGDLKEAVAFSLLKSGVSNMDNIFTPPDESAYAADSWMPNYTDPFSTGTALLDAPITLETANAPGTFDLSAIPDNVGVFTDGSGVVDVDIPIYTDTGWGGSGSPADVSAGVSLSDVAAIALQGLQIYQRMTMPSVQPGTVRAANGQLVTANSNGTLTTRDPATGRTVTVKPQTGVPYALAGGGAIVNNGDGTYTRVNPDGSQVVSRYTAAHAAGVGLSTAALVGIGVLAFIALRHAGS